MAALAALVLSAPASAARTVDIVLTDREPTAVALQPGDSVRFVSGETSALVQHQVTSVERDGSTPWQFDSGPLGPGEASDPFTFTAGGSYVFVDRRGGLGPLGGEELSGRISVTAPAVAPPSPAPQQAAPPPAAPPAPPPPAGTPPAGTTPAQPAPLAPPTGPVGSGATSLPGLTGSVDLDALGAPLAADAVVPPAVADLLADAGAPQTAAELPPVQALQGPLPGAGTSRPLGLPATLAALAAVGVASLLVRVLLAEPAAARSRGLAAVRVQPAT